MALGLLWTLQAPVLAARLTVDVAGSGDHADLQDAADSAFPGDYVVVEPGTYGPLILDGWVGPVVSTRGASATKLVATSGGDSIRVTSTDGARAVIAGFTLETSAGQDGLAVSGAEVVAWDLIVQDAQASLIVSDGGSLSVESAIVLGARSCSLCADGGALDATQVTLVEGQAHLLVDAGGTVSGEQLIAYASTETGSCGSGSMSLSYTLLAEYSGSPIASCMSTDHLLLDFDPGFTAWSDDGDWSNDDFALATDSYLIDAGDPACVERDGTTCDLGATGGERATAADSDEDGMPDAWETAHGLDETTPDDDSDDDADGLDALGEWLFGTDPMDPDSDRDGVPDLLELELSLNPLDSTDQAPTALLSADRDGGFVGEPLGLDASGSTDPAGQILTYTWAIATQPVASTLTDLSLEGALPILVPDAAGPWAVTVTVDDGTWTDSATLEFYVHVDETIAVPGDFPTLQAATAEVIDGMTVVLDAGEHQGPLELDKDVTFRGTGADQTTVKGALQVGGGARVRLVDLSLEGDAPEGDTSAALVQVEQEAWLDLHGVSIHATTGSGLLARNATLTAGWVHVEAATTSLSLIEAVGRIGHSTLTGTQMGVSSEGSQLSLEGALISATRGAVIEHSASGRVDLRQVTAWSDTSITAVNVTGGSASLDSLLLKTASDRQLSCTGSTVLIDAVYLGGTPSEAQTCDAAVPWISDPEPLDADGRPPLDSPAKRAGDIRRASDARLRPDLGAHGGRLGLDEPLGVSDPDADADNDGLAAATEWVLGTSDDTPDSDSDGVDDLRELLEGADPSDPSDHHPEATVTHARVDAGEDATLSVAWPADPDGDACELIWDDGLTDPSRDETTTSSGTWRLGWTLTCGAGASTGEALLMVTEELAVPGDIASLEEALDLADDHHRIILAAGTYTGPLDLRDTWTEVLGAGVDSRVVGDVWSGAGRVQDLTVEGSLYSVEADVTRVAIAEGEWIAHGGTHVNVLVDGQPAWLFDTDTRNLTVDADLFARGALAASVTTGTLTADLDTSPFLFGTGAVGASITGLSGESFVHHDDDPALAVLQPWPGSVLWNTGAMAYADPDGSREDIGYTGGPQAWPTDTDSDGINDAWEALHDVSDPDGDPDGDEVDNDTEWNWGTDPNDPDTDDDGLDDGTDPDPRDPGEVPITARLHVDLTNPVLGQPLTADAIASSAAGGQDLSFTWELIKPADAASELEGEGSQVTLTPDVAGTWWITVTVQAGAYTDSATVTIYTYDEVLVPEDADLQDFVNLVASGTVLVLEKNNYKGSLIVDKDLTLRSQGGTYDASIDGTQGAATVKVIDGAHLTLEALTLWVESGYPGIEIWDGSRVSMQQIRMVGGDTSFRIYDGSFDGRSFFALGGRALLEMVQGSFTARNAVLGYPDPDARAAVTVEQGSVRIESSVFDWRPEDGTWRTPFACMTTEHLCDFEIALYRTLAPGGEGALPLSDYSLDVTHEEAHFLLDPWDADYLGAADLRLDHDSPALDAGQEGAPDADGTRNDQGVFGGAWGNWIDVDNDRDGFSEREGDCDDTDPEVLGDPRQECEETSGCSATPRGPAGWWLVGLLVLSGRRRSG